MQQLTKYSSGSFKELLYISTPIILIFLSQGLLLFIDRLFLSRYSEESLAASVLSGTAANLCMVGLNSINAIVEIFIGHKSGKKNDKSLGNILWQNMWISFLLWPLFIIIAIVVPKIIFQNSSIGIQQRDYFRIIVLFTPFYTMYTAISCFYMAKGNPWLIAKISTIGCAVNVVLDNCLIFGKMYCPELGIKGAAIGTVIALIVQFSILWGVFLSKRYREKYGSWNWKPNKKYIKLILFSGIPSAIANTINSFSLFLFYTYTIQKGIYSMNIMNIVNSLYFIFGFYVEGLSRSVIAIVSNLVGSNKKNLIPKVVKLALISHTVIAILLGCFKLFDYNFIIHIFFGSNSEKFFNNAFFVSNLKVSLLSAHIFFFIDGWTWIIISILSSIKDFWFINITRMIIEIIFYIFIGYIIMIYLDLEIKWAWIQTLIFGIVLLIISISRLMYLKNTSTKSIIKTS